MLCLYLMKFDLNEINQRLKKNLIGRDVHYYNDIESTNDVAFSLGIAGTPEGAVVIADSQRKGKGRFQRLWYSPPAVNIYTSIILRPEIRLANASQIPIFAGVAVAEVVEQYCPGSIRLKWPNDILLDGKKLSGILSQLKTKGNKVDFIVLGIGINVNMKYEQLPEDIRDDAISLSMKTGAQVSRQELLFSVYENLEKWYKKLMLDGFEAVKAKWLSLSFMTGENVKVSFLGETFRGVVKGIDDSGSLMIRNDNNEIILVSAGEATILKG